MTEILVRESVFFADIWNARMLYYRALQRLSDSVAPPDIADARKHIAEELKHQTTCQGSVIPYPYNLYIALHSPILYRFAASEAS